MFVWLTRASFSRPLQFESQGLWLICCLLLYPLLSCFWQLHRSSLASSRLYRLATALTNTTTANLIVLSIVCRFINPGPEVWLVAGRVQFYG